MHRQRGKGDPCNRRNALQPLPNDCQRILGREKQHRPTAPHRKTPETGGTLKRR